MVHITCGNKTPKIPQSGCSDCEQLEERVEALEQCCEDVHIALDDKADETEITEIMHIINGLAAGWHYIGDINGVANLPTSVSAGEAFYDTTTGSWYIAKDDIPSGATINDFLFVSGNDYTLHTATVNGDAVLQLQDSHNHTSNVPVVGEGAVNVEDTGDELTISVDNATTEQAGLMSPEDKDKLDNIDDIYDETCGDPAEFEGQGGANLKSVQVALEPHQAGAPWQDSTLYKTPFLFRKTPSVNHSINSKYTTLVGADVAVNQLVPNDKKSGTITITNDGYADIVSIPFPTTDRIILCSCKFTATNNCQIRLVGYRNGSYAEAVSGVTTNGTVYILTKMSAYVPAGVMYIRAVGTAGDSVSYDNLQFTDLTQYYGSNTIADTAYTKEQTTAGSGIAWLKANGFDFSKYIAYNAGSLESVKPSAMVTRGFNQWDEEWEVGTIDYNTGEPISASNMIRAKNYIPCLPSTTYYQTSTTMNPSAIVTYFYDGEHNLIPYTGTGAYNNAFNGADGIFTTPSNAKYLRFRTSSNYGETYKNDICINLHEDGSRDGEYEQYSEHEYALGNVPLHGIFKEENGNIVAYGDTRTSDGTDTHNYAQVDLGTLNYNTPSATTGLVTASSYLPNQKYYNNNWDTQPQTINSKGYTQRPYYTGNDDDVNSVDKSIGFVGTSNGAVAIRDVAFAGMTGAQVKAALSGVYLTYPLATPTTDTVDSFTNPQVVDNWGTEEYTEANNVPVGNNTRYADVYEITGTDEVTVTVADDPDNPTTSDDYTTALGQTVYEGTVDVVSGKLTVTHGITDPSTLTFTKESDGVFYADITSLSPKEHTSSYYASDVLCSAYETKGVNAIQTSKAGIGYYTYSGNSHSYLYIGNLTYSTGAELKTSLVGTQLVYELSTPIEIDLTPNEINALLGDNYVWSEQGRVCVTFMRDRGELSETLAELQECCDSCDSSGCESDLVVFQHLSADVYNRYPLDSLLPGDDVLYKITVNGNTVIKESAVYDGMWLWSVDNNIELFYDEDDGWMVMANSGEYDIKVETVCNQPLYVNLSASPLDSTQEIVMDKTFQEIEDAYKLGKTVIVRYSNYQHYTPLQVCYDPYTGFFVSIHGYDKATSTFDIFTFLAVLDSDYPTYYAIV